MVSVIFGRRGCGKSTLMRQRVMALSRVLVFDTLAEYGDLGLAVTDSHTLVDTVQDKHQQFFRIIYAPIMEPLEVAFDRFLQVAWCCSDCFLVIDEVEQLASAISIPDSFRRNLSYGRHRNISVLAASRRAAEVPRLLTSQADEIISFNQTEPRDIAYIAAFAGSDFAEATMKLPRYRCMRFLAFDDSNNLQSLDNRAVPFEPA